MQELSVEVVFALPDKQSLLSVKVDAGASVADVIAASGIASAFPGEDLADMRVGIWGRLVEKTDAVADGDRVEIYRPLGMDPREARRRLALAGRTMSDSG